MLDLGFPLCYGVELLQEGIDKLARLCFDISLNMEHREGLLDVLLSKDVGKLTVDLHIKEDIFASQS